MLMDIFILLVGVIIITFCAIDGFARALMQLIIFYIMTLIIGMVLLSVNMTQDLAGRIMSITGKMPSQSMFTSLLFLVILIPTTLGIFLLTHFTMDNFKFTRIQWLDTTLALIVGIILALVFLSLVVNSWGIIVSTVWTPTNVWITLRNAHSTSVIRPLMQRILTFYKSFLFPFKMTRYPIVYTLVP